MVEGWLPGKGPRRRVTVERCLGVSGELALVRAGRRNYEIIANGAFLMATYNRSSERALAGLALAALWETRPRELGAKVLIGGLGVGETLRAALDDSRVESVVVCELEPAVVRWNADHFPRSARVMADPRVTVLVGDVFAHLRGLAGRSLDAGRPQPEPYDIFLADTDNGPDWLVRPENHVLYGRRGLGCALACLTPGGVAAFWSSAEAGWFADNLLSVGFEDVKGIPVRRGASQPDIVYVARRPACQK
ncbi:MAG: spermidine synthase [Bacillota bacterium]|nr:MAG: spermidine synthase [Bacillota bacterium]